MEILLLLQIIGSAIVGIVTVALLIYYGIKRYDSKGREDFKERDF